MLVFVLVSGRETNNARRWIDLAGGFKLQPSELMKLALILFLARWFADRPRLRRLREIWIPCLCCFVPAILILAEPDLGTALSIGPLFFGMVWLAGLPAKKWRLLVILLPHCVLLNLARGRSAWHAVHSLVAIKGDEIQRCSARFDRDELRTTPTFRTGSQNRPVHRGTTNSAQLDTQQAEGDGVV